MNRCNTAVMGYELKYCLGNTLPATSYTFIYQAISQTTHDLRANLHTVICRADLSATINQEAMWRV